MQIEVLRHLMNVRGPALQAGVQVCSAFVISIDLSSPHVSPTSCNQTNDGS